MRVSVKRFCGMILLMPNQPLILRAASLVQGLVLFVDGFPNHQHRLSTRIGDEPLEDGREVTDHVIAAPQGVTLTGVVSDMGGIQRPAAAWQEIVRIWEASEPVRVVTEWEVLNECVIARCDATPSGRGMDFTMELRNIIRVSTSVGPAVPSGSMRGLANNRSGEVSRGRVPLASYP